MIQCEITAANVPTLMVWCSYLKSQKKHMVTLNKSSGARTIKIVRSNPVPSQLSYHRPGTQQRAFQFLHSKCFTLERCWLVTMFHTLLRWWLSTNCRGSRKKLNMCFTLQTNGTWKCVCVCENANKYAACEDDLLERMATEEHLKRTQNKTKYVPVST